MFPQPERKSSSESEKMASAQAVETSDTNYSWTSNTQTMYRAQHYVIYTNPY